MELPLNLSATYIRMSCHRYMRFYVLLLLIAILLTSVTFVLFGSGAFSVSKERELTVGKRSSLACNSSISSVVDLVQCASSPNDCILASFVCDVILDCPDQSDESNATCRGIPSCDEQVGETCLNNGSCVSHPRTTSRVAYHSCKCTSGYTGEYCDVLAPTTTEPPTTTLDPSTTTLKTTAGMITSSDILSTATDRLQTTLSSSSSTLQQLPSGGMGTVTETTPAFTDGQRTTTPFDDGSITTVSASSPSAVTDSPDLQDITSTVAKTAPTTAASLSTLTAPSTSMITTISRTTDVGQPQVPTTNPNPLKSTVTSMTSSSVPTSPSISDMEEVSTTASDEPSTSLDGFTDDVTSTTTTDVSLEPTGEVSSSSTTVTTTTLITTTLLSTAALQEPRTPIKLSFGCDEVDLPLSVVECATPNDCIISIFVCDGVSDCSDGSDESPATCLGEPACDQAPSDVCENGGTCSSNPLTNKRVAHVTCLCPPRFTGDRCLQEAVITTTSSPSLSSTLWTSTLMSITPSKISTDESSSATVLVTQDIEGTLPTIQSLTTERYTTVQGVTTRDVQASTSTSVTSNSALQTFSDSPATEKLTTGNTKVMTSSTTPSTISTDESSSATALVTQDTEDTQPTIQSLTTERDTTIQGVTTRDVQASTSTSLTSNPALQTFSDFPATEELTTGNTEVMTSSADGTFGTSYVTITDVATSDVYTANTVTATMSPWTKQDVHTDTESGSNSPGTPLDVSEIITTPIPLTTDMETPTWTPISTPSTTVIPTTTGDVVPLVTDMITDYVTTVSDVSLKVSVTEATTPMLSSIADFTTGNTDITAGADLSTESSVATGEVSTQLISLKTSATTLATLGPTQTITYTEGESTETVTVPDETTELSTTDETQLSTDTSIMTTFTDTLDKSTMTTRVTEALNSTSITSESFPIMNTTTLGDSYSSIDTMTSTGSDSSTSPEDYTTDVTITGVTSEGTTTSTTSTTTTTLDLEETTQPTSEWSHTTDGFTPSVTSTYKTTFSTEGGTDYQKATTTDATSTQSDVSSPTIPRSHEPTETQVTHFIKRTTEDTATHAGTTLISRHETTDDAASPTTSAKILSTSPSLSTSAVETTELETSSTTGDEDDDQSTPLRTTEGPTVITSRLGTSSSFSTANMSSTTTGDRAASSDSVVLIVLSSTAAVILFLIVCLVIVGCCIARKWRERNSYSEDDQMPLRSLQTYSRQSNRGRKYGQNYLENNKPSFAHRLKPFQSTKLDNESDVHDDSSLYIPPSTTLSIINDYFEQMHGVSNDSLEPDANENNLRNFKELHDKDSDFESESFEMRFFPDTEYWMPSSASDLTDTPYYITDDAPLPVSHV